MWSLYQALDESSPMKFNVYTYLVQLAGRTGQIGLVFTSVESFKAAFMAKSSPATSNEQLQKLLRMLHEILREDKKSELASEIMVLLLDTYTTENASQVRERIERESCTWRVPLIMRLLTYNSRFFIKINETAEWPL